MALKKSKKVFPSVTASATQRKPEAPEFVISHETSQGFMTSRDNAWLGPSGTHSIYKRILPRQCSKAQFCI
jgi:hypothetical protein